MGNTLLGSNPSAVESMEDPAASPIKLDIVLNK